MPELLQADLGLNADCQTISMIVRAVYLKKLAPGHYEFAGVPAWVPRRAPPDVRGRPRTTDRASAIRIARRSMSEVVLGGGVVSSPVMD